MIIGKEIVVITVTIIIVIVTESMTATALNMMITEESRRMFPGEVSQENKNNQLHNRECSLVKANKRIRTINDTIGTNQTLFTSVWLSYHQSVFLIDH